MSTDQNKKRHAWISAAIIFLIVAIGADVKAFYFGFFLSETTHPTKPYKIIISKIPSFLDWQTGTPGDSGNTRIVVRLYNADASKLDEVRTTLHDLYGKMWTDDAAIITTDILWPLTDKQPKFIAIRGSKQIVTLDKAVRAQIEYPQLSAFSEKYL
jgi:hypothetical protein